MNIYSLSTFAFFVFTATNGELTHSSEDPLVIKFSHRLPSKGARHYENCNPERNSRCIRFPWLRKERSSYFCQCNRTGRQQTSANLRRTDGIMDKCVLNVFSVTHRNESIPESSTKKLTSKESMKTSKPRKKSSRLFTPKEFTSTRNGHSRSNLSSTQNNTYITLRIKRIKRAATMVTASRNSAMAPNATVSNTTASGPTTTASNTTASGNTATKLPKTTVPITTINMKSLISLLANYTVTEQYNNATISDNIYDSPKHNETITFATRQDNETITFATRQESIKSTPETTLASSSFTSASDLSAAKDTGDMFRTVSVSAEQNWKTHRPRLLPVIVTETLTSENLINTTSRWTVSKDLPINNSSTEVISSALPRNITKNSLNETKSADVFITSSTLVDSVITSQATSLNINWTARPSRLSLAIETEAATPENLIDTTLNEALSKDLLRNNSSIRDTSNTLLGNVSETFTQTITTTLNQFHDNLQAESSSTTTKYLFRNIPTRTEPPKVSIHKTTNDINNISSTLAPTRNFFLTYSGKAAIPAAIIVSVVVVCLLAAILIIVGIVFYRKQRNRLSLRTNVNEASQKTLRSRSNNTTENVENTNKIEQSHHFINEAFTDDQQLST
ncbi:putative GPI-anchored protein pfl2 isoform X2 [Octopus sinensis]|uniref:GPI-anchored protein pfl2 isoform X2 n=1 Tax=Octopus sinensis TaxID=2607531 RepID=A0A7E6FCF8_9MOLL|nr:putative GPI-anchored protein pfl2 isoform X2 [Octopus sinensis]